MAAKTAEQVAAEPAERACAGCGRRGHFESLCPACYLGEHPLLGTFRTLDVVLCPKCGRQRLAGRWNDVEGVAEAFARTAKRAARPSQGVELTRLSAESAIPPHTREPGVIAEGELTLSVEARVSGVGDLSDEYVVPAKVCYEACPRCSKANTQYFEGVLQLRSVQDDIRKEVRDELRKHASEGVHLTSEEKAKDGVDLYVTSGRFLRSFVRELQKRYGGEVKLTAKLFSRDKQTGKELFRVRALIRFPSFRTGDVISLDGKPVLISSVGEMLHGTDLLAGKKVGVAYVGKDIPVLLRRETHVVRVRPRPEVLHPESYDPVPLGNPALAAGLQPGSSVIVVVADDGRCYLVQQHAHENQQH